MAVEIKMKNIRYRKKRDLLDNWREPGDERKCFAPVTVGIPTTNDITRGFLVEPQIDPANEPAKLDDNPRALKP
jgi:hypothetical protein